MKYNKLKATDEKNITLPVLDKGVNFSQNKFALSDAHLAAAKNVWQRDGLLTNRLGLCADIQNLIGSEMPYGAENFEYRLTLTEVHIEGQYFRIATATACVTESNYFVYVYLVAEDGSVRNIGNMHFGRTSGSVFFVPENITFYAGKAQNGAGIFALVTLVNMIGFTERSYSIYEITADLTAWENVYDYYIPTVYINGRGNGYELAHQLDIAFTGVPKELEALNMLNGRFYAYYSSDSYSSSFRLPFSQLSEETLFCRVYTASQSYTEWCIYGGVNSDTVSFLGSQVRLQVDREKGVITFYVGSSEFAVPQMSGYKENNIRIFAKKDIQNSFKRVVSCKYSTSLSSKTVFSGGNEGSELYFARYDNPLYFPYIMGNQAGSPSSSITALTAFQNKVIAFKENEMYTVEISDETALNTTNMLIDNPATFYTKAKFKIKSISGTVGCKNESSVTMLNGSIIWQSSSGDICSFSGGDITVLSDNISQILKELDHITGIAVAFREYYLLCLGTKAFIMEFTSSKTNVWYIWEFPKECEIIGGFNHNGGIVLVCRSNQYDICCTADFYGDTDIIPTKSGGEISSVQMPIEIAFKTKNYSLTELGKAVKMTRAYLRLYTKEHTKIKLASKNTFCNFELLETADVETVKLRANLKCSEFVNFELKTANSFKLGEAEMYFTKINN